jgi:hypothetical protein
MPFRLGSWGKPGKAGKQATGTAVSGNPSGPQSGSNEIAAAPFRYGRNPISWTQAMRLFNATSLVSPMVAGRFRPQDVSSPVRRAADGESFGTPDLGRLQGFRGSFQGPQTVRLGAQSGPSSQPGFPSTNNDSSVDFSGMGLPDVWRVNTL